MAEQLSSDFIPVIFYYNPNIDPYDEYIKRRVELKNFAQTEGLQYIEGEYDSGSWLERIEPFKDLGEGSERCFECFCYRLEASFSKASDLGIRAVTTSLSISPHKNLNMINRAGKLLEERYGIPFRGEDYKRDGGFQRSVELSSRYGFYRQNYCGCFYSAEERKKKR